MQAFKTQVICDINQCTNVFKKYNDNTLEDNTKNKYVLQNV